MQLSDSKEALVLPVQGMSCASCAGRIERDLRKLDGIHEATVNFATEKANVLYDPVHTDAEHIAGAIEASGFRSTSGTKTPSRDSSFAKSKELDCPMSSNATPS